VRSVTVIDYGAGNLASVARTLAHLGAEVTVTRRAADLARGERLVLPGVGHFAATRRLEEAGMDGAVRAAIARGVPFLGICVGLQWLFAGSSEAPGVAGLGVWPQQCERFPAGVRAPHVGWNSREPRPHSRLMEHVGRGEFVYFTHSYRAPLVEETAAAAEYGGAFSAAVERGNVAAVQFHPEKSGETGLRILGSFLRWEPAC
jgi:glutamine amidotransferase